LFEDPDRLIPWLRTAAHAYGTTLKPDVETGVVGLDGDIPHRERIANVRRGFGPITYRDDMSFEDQVFAAVSTRCMQIESREGGGAGYRLDVAVRSTILQMLGRWRPGDGEAVLHILLGLASRFGIEEVFRIAADLIARGQLSAFGDGWKKSIGLRMSELARAQASINPAAAALLRELDERRDYWTPYMVGNVTGGLIAARHVSDWKPSALRHIEDLERLHPRVQRVQYGQIADAVGPTEFIIDSLGIVPSAFGWDATLLPPSSQPEFRLFKAVIGPETSPFKLDRTSPFAQFVRGGTPVVLDDAAAHAQVVERFRREAPREELDVIDGDFSRVACSQKVDDFRPPEAPDEDDPLAEFLIPEQMFIAATDMYAAGFSR
jgi:hypothetical protein